MKIKLVLCDLDGLLYPYTPELRTAWKRATVMAYRQTAHPCLPGKDEDIHALITESKRKYGESVTFLARDYGIDPRPMHAAIYDFIPDELIERDETMIRAFEQATAQDLKFAILTHGNKPWTERVLAATGLTDIFEDNIFALDTNGYLRKHRGVLAFLNACTHMGFVPGETAFLEDTAQNLEPAHLTGAYTIEVLRDVAPARPRPHYIGFSCETPQTALEQIRETNARGGRNLRTAPA